MRVLEWLRLKQLLNGGRAVASELNIYKELIGNDITYVSSSKKIENWLEKIMSLKKYKKINYKKFTNKFNHKIISNKYLHA